MSGTVARSLGALGDAISGTANVNFDANTLFIDGVNNRVGIGTSAPNYGLDTVVTNPIRGILAQLNNNGPSSLTGTQLAFLQNTINWWTIGQPAATDAFAIWQGRHVGSDGTERMRIDASGRLRVPFQPAFHAYGGGSVSVSTSGYILALSGTATNVGSHFNTSTFRFTAPVAGMYMFAHRVTWGSTGSGVSVFLNVNGSPFSGLSGTTEVFGYSGGYGTTSACVSFVSLNASDFVDLRTTIYNSSTQTLDLTRSSLSGYLMG